MFASPQILEIPSQTTAMIHLTMPRAEIQSLMGPAIGELSATLAQQGIQPIGPLLTYHRKLDPATFDLEVAFPVAQPVTPVGRVQPGQVPGGKIVRTIYRGPYEGLGAAWAEFCNWIKEQGHASGPDVWESYLTGPDSSPDPANWKTELNRTLLPD